MSRWKDAIRYNIGRVEIIVVKAYTDEPVRFYAEVYVDNGYRLSFGSKLPFGWLVALSGFWKVR